MRRRVLRVYAREGYTTAASAKQMTALRSGHAGGQGADRGRFCVGGSFFARAGEQAWELVDCKVACHGGRDAEALADFAPRTENESEGWVAHSQCSLGLLSSMKQSAPSLYECSSSLLPTFCPPSSGCWKTHLERGE